jgi:hypothetical protein
VLVRKDYLTRRNGINSRKGESRRKPAPLPLKCLLKMPRATGFGKDAPPPAEIFDL